MHCVREVLLALVICASPLAARASGSGLNTVVVVNQTSSNSLALGNYYCEKRQIPPQNVLRIQWTGGNIAWTRSQCETVLLLPLRALLTNRSLDHVDYVVLSMDIPYRVTEGASANGTTSVLFYGFRTNGPVSSNPCVMPDSSLNTYAFTEGDFRLSPPTTTNRPFLATMLTGRTLSLARALVDQGVSSDGRFPQQPVFLAKTTDIARNVRFFAFDNAVFDLQIAGRFPAVRTNTNQTVGLTNLLGLQTGLATLTLSSNAFVPGAIGDSLTSYAGELFESSGQTSLLAFTEAGAAGSYGTVTEPCNYLAKFPDPLDYFYQARGFSLAECYYLSLRNPYQGLVVGEPLAAPFARFGSGRWIGLETNCVLAGVAPLSVEFAAADADHPLQRVDLFVDGDKLVTLTNVAPTPGSVLSLNLRGHTATYTVPTGATLKSISEGLADVLNADDFGGSSWVRAIATGDRLELDATNVNLPGAQIPVAVASVGPGAEDPAVFLNAARTNFLDSVARGWRGWDVSGTAETNDYLQATITKTNGEVIVVSVTNQSPPVTSVQLTRQLLALINSYPALTTSNGVSAEDTYADTSDLTFLLFARAPGLAAAQVQFELVGSPNLQISPTNALALDENVGDLRPRNHVYVTAGLTNAVCSFPLDTSSLADGHHEIAAVAYEGSHTRTQTRVTRHVVVRNTELSARLSTSASLGVAAVSDTLWFALKANSDAIASVQLFSTGGLVGVVTNRSAANFAVAAAQLGDGLHPFYALVTDVNGRRYRTETLWIRLSAAPPLVPFGLQWEALPARLVWPAVTGYDYEVFSADEMPGVFSWRATLSATNTGPLEWIDLEPSSAQRFFQVRAMERR